ncbi:YehS family protein [Ureibacillus sinduriensis]|uniref:Cytoplasmic protein n=1 Tax=Ureibacillus sinduriensis BLB-1 = JCM 15800 TaxID=1384057 RepID=A0A0A3HVL3_9BACL|nr:DUF1456 family protein [Ureibacillus sinduriensis]KGR76656.1 hypothetical protein CD33_05710 [Ureibacillus sinduriensis BLB-1 = JCM 15800]
MTNNDLLIRLRYALDIKNTDMVEIFKLGGMELSKAEVLKILSKPKFDEDGEIDLNNPDFELCDYETLEFFLNGFVTFKRGKQEQKANQTKKTPEPTGKRDTANNLFIKRVKVALSLTTEDMIDIFYDAGLNVSKGEIGAILRKADHRNYKECGDNFTRNFIKGLTMRYREPLQQ